MILIGKKPQFHLTKASLSSG